MATFIATLTHPLTERTATSPRSSRPRKNSKCGIRPRC